MHAGTIASLLLAIAQAPATGSSVSREFQPSDSDRCRLVDRFKQQPLQSPPADQVTAIESNLKTEPHWFRVNGKGGALVCKEMSFSDPSTDGLPTFGAERWRFQWSADGQNAAVEIWSGAGELATFTQRCLFARDADDWRRLGPCRIIAVS
jgi:hypothetical protein